MAPTVRDLQAHFDNERDKDDDGEDGGLTITGSDGVTRQLERARLEFNANTFASQAQEWLDAERERQERSYRLVAEAATAEARRKAADTAALSAAQRASEEARDLAKLHQQELESLRKESDATARRYFWYGVAVGAGFVIAGWLLSALSAAQVLSHLFHP